MLTQTLRHSGDTPRRHSLAWQFALRNLFQIVSAGFFAGVSILGVWGVSGVGYTSWTVAAFGVASLSYILLLVVPARRWVRACSVAAPLVAVGLRFFDLTYATPVQPTALLVWGMLAFIYYWVAPNLLPPPLSNGERRRWLNETRN